MAKQHEAMTRYDLVETIRRLRITKRHLSNKNRDYKGQLILLKKRLKKITDEIKVNERNKSSW